MQNQTMCRRRAATVLSAAAAVCCLQILSGIPSASAGSDGRARRTVYYQDASCSLETFQELAYDATSIDSEGLTTQVDFGECYARGSTGAITTCDTTTGTTTTETYLDTSCQVHLYSSADSPACVDLKVEGETCPPGGPGSSTSDCVAQEPAATITPGTFNLVGSPYSDKFCLDRTGGDHVVSGHAFGVGSGDCSLSPLVRGPRYALTKCKEDNTVFAQVFTPEDSACAGDVRLEMVMFPQAATGEADGGMCAKGTFEDGHEEYYRLKSCTTEGETPKNDDIGPTPAPTPSAGDSDSSDSNPDSAPVDYRGDGDDEDLRDDSEDSSSDDHHDNNDHGSSSSSSSDDNNGHSSRDDKDDHSSSNGGEHEDNDAVDSSDDHLHEEDDDCAEDKHGDSHGDSHDSHDRHDSHGDSHESRDSYDTETGSHGDSSDSHGDSDDGITDDTVYAVAFGVSVAFVTAALAALMAFAATDSAKKVAPKCTS